MRNALIAMATSAVFISGCSHSPSTLPQPIGQTRSKNHAGTAPHPRTQFTVLYSFHGPDGSKPNGGLIQDASGNFYGTASGTGAERRGIVYKLDSQGNETVLFRFKAGRSTGRQPSSGLVQDTSGNFYGVTWTGGRYDLGVVYKLDAAGNESVLHSFNGGDGANPQGTLIRDASGNLYGTSYTGGAQNFGAAFKISSTGHETLLHSFGASRVDGAYPEAGMIRTASGVLIGTNNSGGPFDDGTVFKIDSGGREIVLHSFDGSDGKAAQTGLVRDASGILYGTTCGGGIGPGTIFKLDPSGHLTELHRFNGADGDCPQGILIRDSSGNIYGTASFGGSSNLGVIFELDTSGNLIVLHSFSGTDGSLPTQSLFRDTAGNLFGTTYAGGASNDGIIFELTP